ncbi:MAG: ankyrin repeat domain-containing protein [Chitinophagaceae bacterium]|nr:ankyrin repeat domain-containing protein [Chitinophagaceae bacterium]
MTSKLKIAFTAIALLLLHSISFGQSADELIKAIQASDEEKAIAMIAKTDINATDKDGNTALASSAAFSAKVSKALIDAKADVNMPTKTGITPLQNACRWGNADVVKMLIEAGADVNKETMIGSALLVSFNYPSAAIVKMLIDAGAKFKDPVKIANTVNVYPFLQYIKTVKTPDEMVEYYGKSKESWLKLPVKFPDRILNPSPNDFSSAADIVKLFVEKGLDVNQVYDDMRTKVTALDAAMQAGLVEGAKVLMDAGAKYDAEKEIRIPDRWRNENARLPNVAFTNGDYVLAAVLSNKFEFVKFMVDKYPKMVKKVYEGKGIQRCNGAATNYDVKGVDLLMLAAERGNKEIVQYLIEKGAGRGKSVEIKQYKQDKFCPMFSVMFTMGFARNSGNQEIIDIVKNAGFEKE